MKSTSRRGFTLIELLVVISILGTLASVVLVSLNSARIKGKNGRIIEEALSLRNQIELSWNGTYYADLGTSNSTASPVVGYGNLPAAERSIVDDIAAQTPGQTSLNSYGGGPNGFDVGCSSIQEYNASVANNNEYPSSALDTVVIVTNNPCGNATKYAVYVAISPVKIAVDNFINQAYASVGISYDATKYAGYFCVDSSGNSISVPQGRILGNTSYADGLCH